MIALPLVHPRRRRLREWLSGGGDAEITAHVDGCDVCAKRLDAIASEEFDDDTNRLDELFADAVRDAYAPPPDQTARVLETISERERAARELTVFLGLFSIAPAAAELMMPRVGPDDSGDAIVESEPPALGDGTISTDDRPAADDTSNGDDE